MSDQQQYQNNITNNAQRRNTLPLNTSSSNDNTAPNSRITTPFSRGRASSVARIVAPGEEDEQQHHQQKDGSSLHLPPLLSPRSNTTSRNGSSDFTNQMMPTTSNDSSSKDDNNNNSKKETGRTLRSDSIFNNFRSGVLGVNSSSSQQMMMTGFAPGPSSLSSSNNNIYQRSRFMSTMRNKSDPYDQVLYQVEETIYYIEMGACPPAKKVPTQFVNAVNDSRERELWTHPTGRVRDENGQKRWTRVTLPDGSHALGHEADEPAEVPKFPVSVPIENNVLTQYNHPVLVALRENNQFAKKRKKNAPKKLPGADFMPPAVGYGNMNWDGVLRNVCLTQLNIGTTSCNRISRAMILNHTVLSLDLSECAMMDEGCIELCSCLSRNDTVKILNISGNNLSPACGEHLANLIKAPRSKIITLFAACNRLGNETAIEIAKALCDAQNLEFLNLRGNSIDDVGASALLAAAHPSNNATLTALWLQLNLVSEEMTAALKVLMEQKCPQEILRALAPKKKKKRKSKTNTADSMMSSSSNQRPVMSSSSSRRVMSSSSSRRSGSRRSSRR